MAIFLVSVFTSFFTLTTAPSNTGNGSDLIIYGGSHATRALDIELRNNSAAILSWDNSEDCIDIGAGTGTTTRIIGDSIQMNSGGAAASSFRVSTGVSDGTIEYTGGTGVNDGGNLVLYGSTHASDASDFRLRSGGTTIIQWDNSADTLEIKKDVFIEANSLFISSPDSDEVLIENRTASGGVARYFWNDNGDSDENVEFRTDFGATHTFRIGAATGGAGKTYMEIDRTNDVMWVGSSTSALGFYGGAATAVKQTVTGSRGGNAALADLLTKLANLNLITDSTT